MPLEPLFTEIELLSSQIEQLISDKNEENCAALLAQRQVLLEQLANQLVSMSEHAQFAEFQNKYIEFLKSIQVRDNKYLAIVKEESAGILSQSSQQTKVKKAIKAYQNIG